MPPVASILRGVKRRLQGRRSDPAAARLVSEQERMLIPDADFVSEGFDRTASPPTKRMVVILSTPRSGSTHLCELLHRAGFCTTHEYFQPDHYLPLLAHRWSCVDSTRVAWDRYASALERHRTSDQGVLGINLHGSHLRGFSGALPHFSAPKVQYVWLQRRDKLRQAVSFGIAKQTGQWSSEFKASRQPTYDFAFLYNRLRMIHRQEHLIQAFLALRSIAPDVIYYEDFSSDPRSILEPLLDVGLGQALIADDRTLRPQRSSTNDEFLQRLAADILAGRRA